MRQKGSAHDGHCCAWASVKRLPRDYRWPGGRQVAIVFNVAFEGWSEGKAPGVGPMGNPLPSGIFDTNALAWGHYGAVCGIERLLRVLDRTKVRGSVMVSGVFAERIPRSVRAIADAGHEIVAHAYAQEIIPARFSADEDQAHIAKTTDLLARPLEKSRWAGLAAWDPGRGYRAVVAGSGLSMAGRRV